MVLWLLGAADGLKAPHGREKQDVWLAAHQLEMIYHAILSGEAEAIAEIRHWILTGKTGGGGRDGEDVSGDDHDG
jgi:hypothetical protein